MARKKKELFSVEGHPWDKENTPWGQEADFLSRQSELQLEIDQRHFVRKKGAHAPDLVTNGIPGGVQAHARRHADLQEVDGVPSVDNMMAAKAAAVLEF